ncbi:uncharacterized protein RSE6_03434 [Rhynchosporium secalis]|uniref:Uncharacterized protein n=1 Tax=Rhynchosporium secalis TaxID=38038 RepID=A0A1E1M2S2_RHYSE|nr:uncharacterized protein RSE6_03434 [Rhynchosporium secalis]
MYTRGFMVVFNKFDKERSASRAGNTSTITQGLDPYT